MGISAFDVVQANAFIGSQFLTQGKQFFVKPSTGSDGASGRSPRAALKTLAAALAKCTANQNDVVWFMGEGNASAACTDYQSATLAWNKDLVHLIGVQSGVSISPRSRLAFAASYNTASNLFTLSANGCLIANMSFFAGVAGTNPTGCFKVTGSRNRIARCHLAGIGATTNDIAGAYSVKLDGAQENEFDHCTVGLFTTARGAALNAEILFDTAAKENLFENCRIVSQVSHASNHVLVEVADATGIDAFNYFENCKFLYQSANYAVGATGVMRLPVLTQGYLLVDERCGARSDASGTTIKWDVNDRDKIIVLGAATPAADTAGVGRLV
jgi:hypothetical protein